MPINNLSIASNSNLPTASFSCPQALSSSSLATKVNGIFRFQLAALVSCCFYKLYQAYRFTYHASFGLSDHSKLVKCKVLLLKAQESEKTHTAVSFLRECKTLLASITNISVKDKVLLELVKYHVSKGTFDDSYRFADQMSTSVVLEAAVIIQQKFISRKSSDLDLNKLSILFKKAYDVQKASLTSEGDSSVDRINALILIASKVRSFNKQLAAVCIQSAEEYAKTHLKNLNQIEAFYKVALYIDDKESKSKFINDTLNFLETQDFLEVDRFKVHVILASVYHSSDQFFQAFGQEAINLLNLKVKQGSENFLAIPEILDRLVFMKPEIFSEKFRLEPFIAKALVAIKNAIDIAQAESDSIKKRTLLYELVDSYLY